MYGYKILFASLRHFAQSNNTLYYEVKLRGYGPSCLDQSIQAIAKRSPSGVARRIRPIEHNQDALVGVGRVFRFRSAIAWPNCLPSVNTITRLATRRSPKLQTPTTPGLALGNENG